MPQAATPSIIHVPVVPKHAASLLVLRTADAPEVLMGMRGAGHKFMPNRLVFPGGRVDPEDHRAEPATPFAAHVHGGRKRDRGHWRFLLFRALCQGRTREETR